MERTEFGAALRAAIQRSGLPLSTIHQRLRENRTPVSVSALSYWQSGQSRPERVSSLAAVAELERILGQPPEALSTLLGPRKPRGRRKPHPDPPVDYDELWRNPHDIARALAKADSGPADLDVPHKVFQHVAFQLDRAGRLSSVRVRRLLRADHDGTTSFVFMNRCTSMPQPPVVVHTEGCALARARVDVPSWTCAFQFELDTPLAAGELTNVAFTIRLPPGQTDEHVKLALYRPARELALEVAFDPERLPARCDAFYQPRAGTALEPKRGFDVAANGGRAEFITLDPVAGQYWVRWHWS